MIYTTDRPQSPAWGIISPCGTIARNRPNGLKTPWNSVEGMRSYIEKYWAEYLQQTKKSFDQEHPLMAVENHASRNEDPQYQEFMINYIKAESERWEGKKALDYGCGCGRNIKNLLDAAPFERVDGCDISPHNAHYAREYVMGFYDEERCHTWENDGYTLRPAPDEEYDYVMSHIVFQHIANYAIRYSILADMYRVLKPGGTISVHFLDLPPSVGPREMTVDMGNGYVPGGAPIVNYYGCYPPIGMTPEEVGLPEWPLLNCEVEDGGYIQRDFDNIGFVDMDLGVGIDPYILRPSYYMRASKGLEE